MRRLCIAYGVFHRKLFNRCKQRQHNTDRWNSSEERSAGWPEPQFCDNDLSRALAEISGLDIGQTMRRSPEQLADYCELLERFVKHHGQDMVRLRAHLAAGEHDAARVVVHNLLGITGLIGAQRVAALASEIEQRLRTGADTAGVMSLAAECEVELASLADATRVLFQSTAT